jgi:sarcosine oxidase/L-pipecolate oxidase
MVKTQTPSVLIIGGGAFGTSTAYHLSARGYDKVTVLDRFAAPSKDAAATDINKTVRSDYPSLLYSELAQEAMNAWKSPKYPFLGLFHQTGWTMAACEMAKDFVAATHKASSPPKSQYISVEDIKNSWPQFTGRLNGWSSLWSPDAGWVRINCIPK